MIAALTVSRPAALVTLGLLGWLGLAVCLAVAIGLTIREADRRAAEQLAAATPAVLDVEPARPVVEDAGLALVVDVEPATIPLPTVEADLLADVPVEVLSGSEVDARFRQIVQPNSTWETRL